jgi:hypothetical protein
MSRSRIRISIFRSDDCSRAGGGCGGSYCAQRHGECGKQSTLAEKATGGKERRSRGGNRPKRWRLAVPRCSGNFSSEHFWIDWASRGWIMNNVLRLRLAGEGGRQPRGGSHGPALSMRNPETTRLDGRSTSSQRLFERLEAENAQLRGNVVHLMLQIQALRDGAGA